MNKYKVYIPIAFILLVFFALVYFRKDMIRYIAQNKTEQLSSTAKDTIGNYLAKRYNYAQNGQKYRYTFLEFGSVSCAACRQMEGVMGEIRTQYGNTVQVIFINVMRQENRTLSDFFGIAAIPTQVLLDQNGKEFFRHNGFCSAEELSQYFDER